MKFELFILKSGRPHRDVKQTIQSFNQIEIERVSYVDNSMAELNKIEKTADWYGVVYDDEVMQDQLAEALPVFFKEAKEDVLSIFKKCKDDRVFKCPRFFRKHIKLAESGCMPASEEEILPVLNGWLYEN